MRALYAPAVVVISFVLALLLFSCSAGQSERETGEDRVSEEGMGESRAGDTETGDTQGSSADDRSGLRATLVPVAHLTSTRENVSMDELSGISELAVSRELRESAGEALDRSDFEEFDSTDEVLDHVSRNPEAIGLVPWDEVDPRVKALAVDGTSLLDPDAANPESYPLRSGDTAVPNARQLRRIVAAGDIVLDRGQPFAVFEEGRGIDYPLDGGYAAITGRELVPNPYSESELVYQFNAERRGEAGAVKGYLRNADLTLANFENPVLENATYHPEATTFNGDLRLLPILNQGGIDGVTLGNNHILDAGAPGLEETLGHLDDAGISHAGAGEDLDTSREPMIFEVGGMKIGVLSDQGWSEATSTGIFADVVLYEDRTIQARPIPFIILDRSQPNFLVPEAGGQRMLNTIFSASPGPEFAAYEG